MQTFELCGKKTNPRLINKRSLFHIGAIDLSGIRRGCMRKFLQVLKQPLIIIYFLYNTNKSQLIDNYLFHICDLVINNLQ